MSKLARKLIAQEKQDKTGHLDIGHCGISNLNQIPELFNCTWLKTLIISNKWYDYEKSKWIESKNDGKRNYLSSIPEQISRLKNLTELRIGGEPNNRWEVTDISFLESLNSLQSLYLSYNQISDISFLENLSSLQSLYLRYNQISDISFLENLSSLQSLDLSYNQITDYSFLENLSSLQSLDLSSNKISDISFLENLSSLQSLDLSYNKISDYSFLENLSSLHTLDLNNNNISDISFLENLSSLHTLYLSHNNISNYSFLEKLSNLHTLYLSNNNISDISFLENLNSLHTLDLNNNNISDISFLTNLSSLHTLYLSYNKISDYSFLENLSSLHTLDLSNNQISDISFLEKLNSLHTLDLSNNQISDYSFLEKLNSLHTLDLRSNNISDISFLEKLNSLHTLYLSSNNISDISFLEKLNSLHTLYLSNNNISDITPLLPLIKKGVPVSLEQYDWNNKINLYKNPLSVPPKEIVEQGNAAIFDWFTANKKALAEVKVILVGNGKAGKTSLLRRLKDGTYSDDEEQTDGINIESIAFADATAETETGDKTNIFEKQTNLHGLTGHFWDFGGQEIMSATHQFFLTNRSVYVLLLDARKDNKVASQIRGWVKQIIATGGNSPILLVANKIDLNTAFGFQNISELQAEFPQIVGFLKVSCKDETGLDDFKGKLAEIIPKAELFNTEIDERWLIIKEQLQAETKADNYLDETRFKEICVSAGLTEQRQQQNAITFLNDLGLVLHFNEVQLAEYYVLNPYWITYGVYQILTSKLAGKKGGLICMENDLDEIINIEEDKEKVYRVDNYQKIEYSTNQRRFLVDVLNQFKLAFYRNEKEFIIPDLLPTAEPTENTAAIKNAKNKLAFAYKYDPMPKWVIPQIMVELHNILTDMWRTGCVLNIIGNTQALITSYDDKLSITVTGEGKTMREFMAVIRFKIDKINSHLTEKPKKLVPLSGSNNYVSYSALLKKEKRGETHYIDDESDNEAEYLISELLDGFKTEIKDVHNPELIKVIENLKRIEEKVDKGNEASERGIKELKSGQIISYEKLNDIHLSVLQTFSKEDAKEFAQDLETLITTEFATLTDDLNDELKKLYADLKNSSAHELKIKAGFSFLGLGLEYKLDVKKIAEQMSVKYPELIETFNQLIPK